MLRDILRGSADVDHVLARMEDVGADVWVLQSVDYDADGLTIGAFAKAAGFAHFYTSRPNTGLRSNVDLDGDGVRDGPRDAQGYGWFTGQGGMAILSRYPIIDVRDYSALIWADLPWATLPDGFFSAEALSVHRLPTTAHWAVQVDAPGGKVTVLAAHATPPVFDGPEDRNGLRNADEARLLWHMAGEVEWPFVIAANLNLDPERGDGRRAVIAELLTKVQDPLPGLATVDFERPDAGRMRVSYVLPSPNLRVLRAGVAWEAAPLSGEFTRHHPVWVDLMLDGGG